MVMEKAFWGLQNGFSFGAWLRQPGGQGGFRPPPYAPLDPLYPLQTAEGYPRTPLVAAMDTSPCHLTDRVRIGPLHLVWPGARNQSGAGAGMHFAWPWCRGACRYTGALPWRYLVMTLRITRRPNAGGGISCAEGDSGPPRDGCEPSWARPCEASGALLLSNGGSGGGHETCTLWPPPAPFGYFPVMESTSSARRRTKPPTRNKLLAEGRKRAYLSFSASQRISPLRRRPGGFPVAPWTPSGVHLLRRMGRPTKIGFLVGGKGKMFACFSCFVEGFASAEATRGLSGRPLDPFGGPPLEANGKAYKNWILYGRQGKDASLLFLFRGGFRLCGGDQGAFRSPPGPLREPSS